MDNFCLLSDSYKVSHWGQYPPKTTSVYSYFESRGGVYPEVCFFGLQYFLKRYLEGVVVTREKIDEAAELYALHLPKGLFNRAGWEHILDKHKGRLPLRICAVEEGSVVPVKQALLTVENTDPQCFWLTNYVETLLVQVWYPMTVATHSREQKKALAAYLHATGGDSAEMKLVDFGFRGVSSVETAGIGGCAHLVNFAVTDNVASLVVARKYYGCQCAGFSVPASEHSTMTAWGRDGEAGAMRNMLETYPAGPVACVSDSFDIFKACGDVWGTELKDQILDRDGCLIVRPDSGDPLTTAVKVLDILGEKFGTTLNRNGFKVLHPNVRVLWGDGIDHDSLCDILATLKARGWSADNIAFGSGGGLLQKLNRDTQKCAFKCSSVIVDGEHRNVYKDPITDPGKVSKKGRLALLDGPNGLYTRTECAPGVAVSGDLLLPVFEDGVVLRTCTLDEVRARAALPPLDTLPLKGTAFLG
ncbi:nicotinate phosphoribosyltransferase family-domain-containing protein [Pelagophyceae sp. CCMP2097]|nr:nicotinate phosphoribosyltransferase family-domain-containing protein [Pelagophyceae sp. CCMP2097]